MVDAVITGHRPKKLPKIDDLESAFTRTFQHLRIRRIIQGLADGADLISARAAYRAGLPFVSVRPGMWHRPGRGWERDYYFALKYAERNDLVDLQDRPFPGAWIYQKRNEAMVDQIHAQHQDVVIAVWDGSPSGTKNCVDYALKKNLRIWRIDPNTLEGKWLK